MEQKMMKTVLFRAFLLVLVAVVALSAISCGTEEGSEGEKTFTFTVVTLDGVVAEEIEITTDCQMVGEALLERELIEGEQGAYGLYVKKVCGIVADYDVDGTYWSFLINGEYAMTGVDTTPIENGAVYTLQVAK